MKRQALMFLGIALFCGFMTLGMIWGFERMSDTARVATIVLASCGLGLMALGTIKDERKEDEL